MGFLNYDQLCSSHESTLKLLEKRRWKWIITNNFASFMNFLHGPWYCERYNTIPSCFQLWESIAIKQTKRKMLWVVDCGSLKGELTLVRFSLTPRCLWSWISQLGTMWSLSMTWPSSTVRYLASGTQIYTSDWEAETSPASQCNMELTQLGRERHWTKTAAWFLTSSFPFSCLNNSFVSFSISCEGVWNHKIELFTFCFCRRRWKGDQVAAFAHEAVVLQRWCHSCVSSHTHTMLHNTATQCCSTTQPAPQCNTAMQCRNATPQCNAAVQHRNAMLQCNTAMQCHNAIPQCNTAMQHSKDTTLQHNTATQHPNATPQHNTTQQ